MIDIKFLRENPDVVKENIKKKFQDHKLVLVDEAKRKTLSNEIGNLMKQGQKDEAEKIKAEVQNINDELIENEKREAELAEAIKERMMKIPNIIDPSVPIGKDDSENVEVQRFGDPVVPSYEIPHHADIIARFKRFRQRICRTYKRCWILLFNW